MTVLPTFIIGGAPKAGTTALWMYFQARRDVCMASIKEPRFFSEMQGELERGVIGEGPNRGGRYAEGLAWYESLFSHCNRNPRAIGEASTYYFSAPDSPALIRRYLPDVRLVFLLRDPVRRAYSHYWEEDKLGWNLPSFEEMVIKDHPRLRHYLQVSAYRDNLQRFEAEFPRSQICVLTAESLRANPKSVLAEACSFLDLDFDDSADVLAAEHNAQVTPRFRPLQRAISAIHGSGLPALLPGGVRRVLGRARKGLMTVNSRPISYPRLSQDVEQILRERTGEHTSYVEAWLGRAIPEWR